MTGKYDDIINLPHHVSLKHPQMSMLERAAQFSPFAALSGHDAAIRESGRVVTAKIELDESAKDEISAKLGELLASDQQTNVEIQYFVRDKRKNGGVYVSKTCVIKKFDPIKNILLMNDGSKIEVENILSVHKA